MLTENPGPVAKLYLKEVASWRQLHQNLEHHDLVSGSAKSKQLIIIPQYTQRILQNCIETQTNPKKGTYSL